MVSLNSLKSLPGTKHHVKCSLTLKINSRTFFFSDNELKLGLITNGTDRTEIFLNWHILGLLQFFCKELSSKNCENFNVHPHNSGPLFAALSII